MSRASLFTRERYLHISHAVLAAGVIYTAVELFAIGGDAFVIELAYAVTSILSLITGVTVFWLWRRFLPFYNRRALWEWFLVGWGMWAIGDLWFVVEYWIKGYETFPGMPDIFLVIGYIGLIIGMVLRLRETNRKVVWHQVTVLAILSLILVLLTVAFAVLPAMQTPETGFLAAALPIAYPIFDLVLIMLGISLLVDYNARRSRIGWRLIVAGFVMIYITDVIYAYTTHAGLLFPGGQVNLISTLGYALPYGFAYVLWSMGLYGLQVKMTTRIREKSIVQPLLVENTHILFYLNPHMMVDEVSTNYLRVFQDTPTAGQPLTALLPLTPQETARIRGDLFKRGKLTDMPLEVTNRKGQNLQAKLCGIHLLDSQKALSGGLLVLRVVSDANNLDLELNDYQQSLVNMVRTKSNSSEAQDAVAFMHAFYIPFFKRIYEVMLENGGGQQGVNYEEILNRQAEKSGWTLKVESGSLELSPKSPPKQVIKELPALLMAAREQLGKLIDSEEVDAEVRLVRSGFSDSVMNNLYYIEHAWVNLAE